jgi:hypothetical protein
MRACAVRGGFIFLMTEPIPSVGSHFIIAVFEVLLVGLKSRARWFNRSFAIRFFYHGVADDCDRHRQAELGQTNPLAIVRMTGPGSIE